MSQRQTAGPDRCPGRRCRPSPCSGPTRRRQALSPRQPSELASRPRSWSRERRSSRHRYQGHPHLVRPIHGDAGWMLSDHDLESRAGQVSRHSGRATVSVSGFTTQTRRDAEITTIEVERVGCAASGPTSGRVHRRLDLRRGECAIEDAYFIDATREVLAPDRNSADAQQPLVAPMLPVCASVFTCVPFT